jgi:hypothetical protein
MKHLLGGSVVCVLLIVQALEHGARQCLECWPSRVWSCALSNTWSFGSQLAFSSPETGGLRILESVPRNGNTAWVFMARASWNDLHHWHAFVQARSRWQEPQCW